MVIDRKDSITLSGKLGGSFSYYYGPNYDTLYSHLNNVKYEFTKLFPGSMVNEQEFFKKLQEIIGETKSADMINERWSEVLERLDQLSIEYSKELQAETGARYDKDGKHDIWLFPPFRLLAMNLILSYWIGWISVPKKLNLVSDWRRIEAAYNNGKDAFFEHEKTKAG